MSRRRRPWIGRLRRGVKVALGWEQVRLERTLYPDDTLLVSYPKSGNTWLRFLVANAISGADEPVSFAALERWVPDIYRHSDRVLRGLPRPRLLKSHEPFHPQYRKVVYLVRDPRDVAVSSYHFEIRKRRITEEFPMEEFVDLFLQEDQGRFGSWRENVGSWVGARQGTEGFLLLRYEDLLEDTERQLDSVLSFLGREADDTKLRWAVEVSAAGPLRRLEMKEHAARMFGSREDKPLVRRAEAGNWREELPEPCAESLVATWGALMKELGYPV